MNSSETGLPERQTNNCSLFLFLTTKLNQSNCKTLLIEREREREEAIIASWNKHRSLAAGRLFRLRIKNPHFQFLDLQHGARVYNHCISTHNPLLWSDGQFKSLHTCIWFLWMLSVSICVSVVLLIVFAAFRDLWFCLLLQLMEMRIWCDLKLRWWKLWMTPNVD